MKLRVLGCSGGIGKGSSTTSMLLDDDILIDAGTGVSNLTLDELVKIRHVFVTHSHLDHIALIPFLIDTVGCLREFPLVVHGIPPTLEAIQKHLFNWEIWPDFTKIPNGENPYLTYESLTIGRKVDLGGRKLTPLPANHVVPAVGFQLDSGSASLVFTGDTTTNDALWVEVNKIQNLKYLIIEVAFCNAKKDIAIRSKHLCPTMLAEELEKLEQDVEIFIAHLRQGEADKTMQEIEICAGQFNSRRLLNNQIFEF